jgi:hypothetical protein
LPPTVPHRTAAQGRASPTRASGAGPPGAGRMPVARPGVAHLPSSVIGSFGAEDERQRGPNSARKPCGVPWPSWPCSGAGRMPVARPGAAHFPTSVIGGFDAEDERQSEPDPARRPCGVPWPSWPCSGAGRMPISANLRPHCFQAVPHSNPKITGSGHISLAGDAADRPRRADDGYRMSTPQKFERLRSTLRR